MPFFGKHNKNSTWRRSFRRTRSSASAEQQALDGSVNLDDIIGTYDNLSRLSASSVASNIRQFSQSYFSANGNRDDDTTSFYTALTNGLTVEQDEDPCLYSPDLLWDSSETSNRDMKSPSSHFQVFWEDLVYKIEPKISLSLLWYNLERIFKPNISRISQSVFCCIAPGKFNCNSAEDDQFFKTRSTTIIQQINGSFKSGELTAVIGPSGAGKTSLLNFLSRRREDGYTGQLYVDESKRKIKISTIPQHDRLPEYLSVRENLMFASRLKNTQPNYDHGKNIETVSNLLGLGDCLDTRTKKISGGQQKRLAIAQELLSKPEILILDEPTSGLDSLTCHRTLSVLKNLVRSSARKLIDPIAIVVTIHQPQQEVFEIFDKVYVMANGGIAIYNGTPDKCTEFIEQHGGIQMIDKDYNPASFLIEVASGEYGDEPIKKLASQVRKEFKSLKRLGVGSTADNSKKSGTISSISQYELNEVSFANGNKQKTSLCIDPRIAKGSSMNRGHFWSKTRILSERCWLSIIRDPKQMIARILFHIILPIALALILGTDPGKANACPRYKPQYELKELVTSNELTSDEPEKELLLTLENIALLFILIYSLTSANIGAITLTFTLDMQRSLKEFYNGWYSMPSYIIASFITELPMEFFMPIITLSLGYPLTAQMPGDGGITNGYRLAITTLAVILGSMIGQTIGMIFGAIYFGHVSAALFAAQGSTLPMVFLSGFVTRTRTMTKLIYSLSFASFYRHVLEIATIARYGFNVCKCNPENIASNVKLVGVSEDLRSFTKYWMESQSDGTSSNNDSNSTGSSDDMFQLIAKQISLYNTYGVEIKSCKDVRPHLLHDLNLQENDLFYSFIALIILLFVMKVILFITVKLVIRFKTSL